MRIRALGGCGIALLPLLTLAPAGDVIAQLLQHKDLSYGIAKTIAETAVEDCRVRGYAVAAVVVDRGGDTMVALRAATPRRIPWKTRGARPTRRAPSA